MSAQDTDEGHKKWQQWVFLESSDVSSGDDVCPCTGWGLLSLKMSKYGGGGRAWQCYITTVTHSTPTILLSATEASQIMSSICDLHFNPRCRVPSPLAHLQPATDFWIGTNVVSAWAKSVTRDNDAIWSHKQNLTIAQQILSHILPLREVSCQ